MIRRSKAVVAAWGLLVCAACGEPEPGPRTTPPAVGQQGHAEVVEVREVTSRPVAHPVVEPAPVAGDPEPNDTWREAVPLQAGVAVDGWVAQPDDPAVGDEDWFVLTVPGEQPALVRAELSGAPDLDLVLEWMPGKDERRPRALVQADVHEREPGGEVLAALRVPPGQAWFRVREAWYRGRARTGSAQPYRLLVTVSEWRPGIEAEPDDTAEDAIPLPLTEHGRGSLGHIKDRDVWRVELDTLTAGSAVQVAITGIPEVELIGSLAFAGHSGEVVTGRSPPGAGLLFRHLGVPEPRPEALLVTIRSPRAAAPGSVYELQVTPEEESEERVEVEPNDSAPRATPLTAGRISGYIDRGRDVDLYVVVVDDATTLHAVLSPPIEVDLALELRDPEGKTVRTLDEGRSGDGEILRAFGVSPGPWILAVRGHDAAACDPRRPYALELTLDAAAAAGEAEPNDARDQASRSRLVPGGDGGGWIHPHGDVDWWQLEVPAGDAGRIVTFRVTPPPGVPLDVALHSPDGERLVGREGLLPADAATFTYYLDPGSYFVRVASPDAAAANPRDAYRLAVLD